MKRIVLIDCDPGHDDAIALLMAFASEQLDVRAVTVSAGNQTAEKTLHNAKRIISLAGTTPKVAKGAGHPLVRELIVAPSVHGDSGMDGPDIPDSDLIEEPYGAVELLYREIQKAGNEGQKVTLVATGPLTNIAALYLAHPDVKPHIEVLSIMGGAVYGGNWAPAAEFNILVDPEAADIVFRSGVPLVMCGLDVTHKALVLPEDVEMLRAMGGRIPVITAELLDFFWKFHQSQGFAGSPVHDACAVAYLIAPELFTTVDYHVDIETQGLYTTGSTVADIYGVTGKAPNTKVCMDIDREGFIKLLRTTMEHYLEKEKKKGEIQ
jgi:pyrimidine-specific ribonucleoside hydrolase